MQCSGAGIVQFVIVKFSKGIVEWSRDERCFSVGSTELRRLQSSAVE